VRRTGREEYSPGRVLLWILIPWQSTDLRVFGRLAPSSACSFCGEVEICRRSDGSCWGGESIEEA
jgi:hypothetical protein